MRKYRSRRRSSTQQQDTDGSAEESGGEKRVQARARRPAAVQWAHSVRRPGVRLLCVIALPVHVLFVVRVHLSLRPATFADRRHRRSCRWMADAATAAEATPNKPVRLDGRQSNATRAHQADSGRRWSREEEDGWTGRMDGWMQRHEEEGRSQWGHSNGSVHVNHPSYSSLH